MNRRQLVFVIVVNALISLVIALIVAWIIELRRPDLEELAAQFTPAPLAVIAMTPTVAAGNGGAEPAVAASNDAAAASSTVTPETAESEVYIVQAGDSLLGIALRYNLTIDDIVAANELSNPDFVFSGQRLIIPRDGAAGSSASTAPNPSAVSAVTPVVFGVKIEALESPGDLAAEAILIVNDSDLPLNLQGWQLMREDGPVYTFGNLPLFAGSGIRLFSGQGTDNSIALYWGQADAVWGDGTEARLMDTDGELVDSYAAP